MNVSSVAGRVAPAGFAAYAATKWGINGWSEALRVELQPDVRVIVIEPGATATELPFAVSLTTHVNRLAAHVSTEVGTVSLTDADVDRFGAAGRAAPDATEVLVGGRLHGLETNHAYTVPKTYLDQLAPPERAALAPLFP